MFTIGGNEFVRENYSGFFFQNCGLQGRYKNKYIGQNVYIEIYIFIYIYIKIYNT